MISYFLGIDFMLCRWIHYVALIQIRSPHHHRAQRFSGNKLHGEVLGWLTASIAVVQKSRVTRRKNDDLIKSKPNTNLECSVLEFLSVFSFHILFSFIFQSFFFLKWRRWRNTERPQHFKPSQTASNFSRKKVCWSGHEQFKYWCSPKCYKQSNELLLDGSVGRLKSEWQHFTRDFLSIEVGNPILTCPEWVLCL